MSTKVLVFESDAAFAGELRNELGLLGCATTVVDDGNVGLQQAAADKPDLILLSIELPRMNGFSVCNKLKKDPNLKDVPLIIMSSESSDETFEQHKKLRTRAEDYVHKPVAFGELLQHIQSFVALGTPAADPDATIVIDDEIEVGATDYLLDEDPSETLVAPFAGMILDAQVGEPRPAPVEPDVDAFAESAFGRMTSRESRPSLTPTASIPPAQSVPPVTVPPPRDVHALRNGASSIPAPPAPSSQPILAAARASITPSPPSMRPGSLRPAAIASIEPAEYERVRDELVRAKDQLSENDRQLYDAQQEIEKLRIEAGEAERLGREIEELKVKLAAGAKGGAISSREFLDLREALNKKDKEILGLREQLSRKDKEIVEAQDRALNLERSKADIDDRLLGLERELSETKEKSDALSADKDLAKKASEDFRVRLEKAKVELDGRERQLTDLRNRQVEERASNEAKLASARADLDQVLANERASYARAIDEVEERRRADLDQARRDRDASLAAAQADADRARVSALEAQASELAAEHTQATSTLRRSLEDDLARARNEAGDRLREAESRHGAEVAAIRTEVEQREQAALEALRVAHTEQLSALGNERDAHVAAIESKAARELGEANDKLMKLEVDVSALRGDLESLRDAKATGESASAARIDDLEKRLAALQAERDALTGKLGELGRRADALDADLTGARSELEEARSKLGRESARADRATAKWDADKQSLERAKDALAVALSQIEETEGRAL